MLNFLKSSLPSKLILFAHFLGLIDNATAQRLLAQEGEWTEEAKSGGSSAPTEVTSPLQTLTRERNSKNLSPRSPAQLHGQNGNVPKVWMKLIVETKSLNYFSMQNSHDSKKK